MTFELLTLMVEVSVSIAPVQTDKLQLASYCKHCYVGKTPNQKY